MRRLINVNSSPYFLKNLYIYVNIERIIQRATALSMYMGSQTFALRTLLKAYIRYKYANNMFRIYTETYEDDRPKLYGNNYRAHIVQTTGSSSQHCSLLVSINQFSAFVNLDVHSFLNIQLGQLSWSASVEVLKRKSNYKVIEQVIKVFAVLKTVCM